MQAGAHYGIDNADASDTSGDSGADEAVHNDSQSTKRRKLASVPREPKLDEIEAEFWRIVESPDEVRARPGLKFPSEEITAVLHTGTAPVHNRNSGAVLVLVTSSCCSRHDGSICHTVSVQSAGVTSLKRGTKMVQLVKAPARANQEHRMPQAPCPDGSLLCCKGC